METFAQPELTPEEPHAASVYARYLAWWAATLVALLALCAAFCAAVDPYAVLGTPPMPGLTARKPAAADWPRLTKAYVVQRVQPHTLVLGNSSADVGFNPESPAWPRPARPVYNLGIDGGLPQTDLRFLQHALAVSHPAQVIIPVDFVESMVNAPQKVTVATDGEFDFENRMRVAPDMSPNPGYWRARLADISFTTLSYTALADSLRTVLTQNDPGATFETGLGWNDGGKFRRWVREDGFATLFADKDHEKIRQWQRWRGWRHVQEDPVVQMARLALSRGAQPVILILPNHADIMEALRQLGLDADQDAWKTRLVANIAAIGGAVPIWDFSGYSPYTTEAVPAPGNRAQKLRWFYEPIHFQPELGDLMIARIENTGGAADFGTRLNAANIAARIAQYHAAQANWVRAHPADVARIAAIMAAP